MTKKTSKNTTNAPEDTKVQDQSQSTAKNTASKADNTAKNKPIKEPITKPKNNDKNKKKNSSSGLILLIFILIIVLSAGLWFVYQRVEHSLSSVNNLENAIQENDKQRTSAIEQASNAVSMVKSQNEVINSLRQKIADTNAQINDLSKSFQLIADRGSDLVLVNDIEHLVTIAQQQLQLSGSVANAIISLETAQAQLARANKPELASLQQTINGDLDKLRATSTVDVAMLSHRLDELASLVAQAPLIVPDIASASRTESDNASTTSDINREEKTESTVSSADTDIPWWKNAFKVTSDLASSAAATLKHDLNEFVSVIRVDDSAALLISPDQATRFRDNLRLRIMTAQLALLMGQEKIWNAETSAVLKAIETRFDEKSALSRKAIRIARDVADTDIGVALPTVDNSIKAIEAIRDKNTFNVAEPSADSNTKSVADQ